jgi:hypothetical protein
MELDHQCLFGLGVHSCTHWLRPGTLGDPLLWMDHGCCLEMGHWTFLLQIKDLLGDISVALQH